MKEHRFLAEVLDDLETTMNWLDSRREGLGEEFEFEFLSAVQVARSRPDTFSADQTGYRPVKLKRFSAVMYFTIENNVVVVGGVFMGGRSESQLRNRG